MRKGIEVEVAGDDRARLEARQKHLERVRIVLLTADGVGTLAIMRQVGCATGTVWRWQERFATEGVAGLLCDKSRPPGKTPLPRRWSSGWLSRRSASRPSPRPIGPAARWRQPAACRCARYSGSGRRTASSRTGCGASAVHRSAAKLRAVVGLCLDPPAHSLVLSVDEKSHV
jgi:hypothetical protein